MPTEADGKNSSYDYVPLAWANLTALVLFAIAWAMHTGLGIFYRQYWFGTCFFISMGLETAGYIGRYISSSDVLNDNAFTVQIVCLTLAPAFFMAGMYYLLAEIIVIYGVKHSRFKPWTYSKVFICMDLVSIILQGTGGGIAAAAVRNNKDLAGGTHIMIGGLAFQTFATSVFFVCCIDYSVRVWKWRRSVAGADEYSHPAHLAGSANLAHLRNSKKTKYFLLAAVAATVFVFVRSVYRVFELSYGWRGYLMISEGYFLVLDTLMVFIGSWTMFLFYPGYFLGRVKITAEFTAALATAESVSPEKSESQSQA